MRGADVVRALWRALRVCVWATFLLVLYAVSLRRLLSTIDGCGRRDPSAPARLPKKPSQGRLYTVVPSHEGVITLALMRRYDTIERLVHVHVDVYSPGWCRTVDDVKRPFVRIADRHHMYDVAGYGRVYFHDPTRDELRLAGERLCDAGAGRGAEL